MLAKLTAKNQITIPKKVLAQLPKELQYFEMKIQEGVVLLRPITIHETNTEQIWDKMKKLGLTDKSVAGAIQWARTK